MSDNSTSGIDAEELRQMLTGALAQEPQANTLPGLNDVADIIGDDRPEVDVTSPSAMHLWLQRNIGVGCLSHLYRKHGALVRVVPGAVEPMRAKELRAEIDYAFRSVKITEKFGKQEVNFPLIAAENAVGAVHRLTSAQDLLGITSIPLFRSDGDLIDQPGYDAMTKMLYQPDPALKIHVPEEPTRQDLFEAATLVKYPVAEFPFETEADKANWLGLAFTPLLRYLAPGPYKLGIIEAHQPGSGKGYLAGMLRKLHGGTLRGALPDSEAEMRKTITTALMGAEGIVVFDNVKGKISSSALEALLTAETWSDRILGGNQDATMPNDRLWLLTGNNASLGGDMARRVLKVRLDAGPSPEQRTHFAIANPVKWMDDHRSEYLSALMTIIRSWLYAGAPMPAATSSDSYALWRQMVSGILSHAGLGSEFDSSATRPVLTGEDEEWELFLTAVHVHFKGAAWATGELVRAINFNPELLESLPSEAVHKRAKTDDRGFSVSLSKFLGFRNRRWFGEAMVGKVEPPKDANGKPKKVPAKWETFLLS